ncbi:MAG TPA: DUF3667 domain-containing protein [Chthoniobacterales bacterium]|nr:DUF3667 domain-containing protein [Chthoniobacterales bacterium]
MSAYCSACGEKRRDRDDWKLSSIAGETFAEITNLEHSKLWQTFRLLLLKPGQLTRDYWNGRRKRYLGPVKLYLVFFALSLVLYSIHRPTAVYDVRTFTAANPVGWLPRFLDELAIKRGMPGPQFVEEVNSRWQSYISMTQVIYPLFVALGLMLLLRRRRFYFAEHLIFALHLLAFVFLSLSLLWPVYALFRLQTSPEIFTPSYILFTVGSIAWTAVYLLLAMRRAYAEPWLPTVIKSAVVYLTYFLTSMIFMSATLALAVALTRRAG